MPKSAAGVAGPAAGGAAAAAIASAPSAAPFAASPPAAGAPRAPATRRSHKLRNALIAAGVVALVLVLSVIGYAAMHPQPTLSLSTTTVQAGTNLVVSASHLPANQVGDVELLSQVRTFQFRADAGGNAAVEVAVPREIGTGDHIVRLCWAGACHNSATLHVTPPAALASPTPSPTASPSPSHTPTLPSIRLSSNTVKIGGTVTIAGKDYDPSKPVTIVLLQDKLTKTLVTQPVNPRADGTFYVTVTIPSGVSPGSAEIVACSYTPGQSGSSSGGCGAQPVTVTR